MRFYEYDSQGWLVGSHEDANRPSSTPLDFRPIPPARARWDGAQWSEDPAREIANAAQESDQLTQRQQALSLLRAFDHDTATASDVKNAVVAIIRILPNL
jgi:hypothetical protein